MVPAPPVVAVAPKRGHRLWALPMAGIGFLLLAAVVIAPTITAARFSQIKRPYGIVPSGAEDVEPRLSFADAKRYRADGEILFVTIRQPQLSVLSWFMVRNENDVRLLTNEEANGNGTSQQQSVRGRRQMVSAKQAAEYAALTKLGYPIKLKQGSIVVEQIVCLKVSDDGSKCDTEAPSGKVLEPDDELISIDGTAVEALDDLQAILKGHKAGDMVEVEFNRPGKNDPQKGTIELIASPDDAQRIIIGFYPFDTTEVGAAPFDVSIDTDGIGGPSAGLAFALTLIDELTPGELTGGLRVAVTGTIDVEGDVGAIGGLPQKASAVRQTGTKIFLVPAGQSDDDIAEARRVAGPGVRIIRVATLDEALAVLVKLGGNGDKLGQPGKDFNPVV